MMDVDRTSGVSTLRWPSTVKKLRSERAGLGRRQAQRRLIFGEGGCVESAASKEAGRGQGSGELKI